MKAFLCHSGTDAFFVIEVAKYLKRCFDDVFYYEENLRIDEELRTTIKRELNESQVIIIFAGKKLTEWQEFELQYAKELHEVNKRNFCIYLIEHNNCPIELRDYQYEVIKKSFRFTFFISPYDWWMTFHQSSFPFNPLPRTGF